MQSVLVIDRNLFTRPDVAQRKEHYVTVNGFNVGVRLARVIDVVGAVAAMAPIQAPAAINIADAQDAPIAGSSSRFEICYSLAGVFSDLLAPPKMNSCKTALAVNWRFAN